MSVNAVNGMDGREKRRGEAYPDVLDDVVFKDQSVPVGADAETVSGEILVQADLLRPLCAVVGEGNNLSWSEGGKVSLK